VNGSVPPRAVEWSRVRAPRTPPAAGRFAAADLCRVAVAPRTPPLELGAEAAGAFELLELFEPAAPPELAEPLELTELLDLTELLELFEVFELLELTELLDVFELFEVLALFELDGLLGLELLALVGAQLVELP
jgi:hypothetical protein